MERAAKRGVTHLALTDHDTLDGYGEARETGERVGVEVIPGIELSAWHTREVHLLGYFVDPEHPELRATTARQATARIERVYEICAKLAEIGVELDAEAILASSPRGNVGRPHIARALMHKGYARSFDEVFRRYLGANAPAYVPAARLTVGDAIGLVHRAGGAAVIAHPGVEGLAHALPEMTALGLDGLESEHPAHCRRTARRFRKHARELDLVATGGSDFHYPEGKAELGDVGIDLERFEVLRDRAARYGRDLPVGPSIDPA